MEGFTKAMAIELAPHKIRVNSLGPTFLETPMTRPFFENKAFREEVLAKIKLGRLGQLEELTGAIVFPASDASSLMTGSALVLDGGWTAERVRDGCCENHRMQLSSNDIATPVANGPILVVGNVNHFAYHVSRSSLIVRRGTS